MRTITALALGLGFFGVFKLVTHAQEKKADPPKLDGKYTLVGGKVNGTPVADDAKKAEYSFTADKITIKGKDLMFVMSYKIDPKTSPMNVDMEILDGPGGAKGAKALGIIEVKGDTVKLAYSTEKDTRPKDFKGEKDFLFELKKAK